MHFASRLTGWNAIKSRVTQLNIDMTDEQCKECTAKIKLLADIRPIAIDDADSIIHAFHRSIVAGKPLESLGSLLPNMTAEEKSALASMENRGRAGDMADAPPTKKAKAEIAA